MRKLPFARLVAVLLALVMAFGAGALVPAMAVTSVHGMMAQDMPGMDMSAHQDSKDCCNPFNTNRDTKGDICASACAAMAQATLPSSQPVFVRRVATPLRRYAIETTALGRLLPPDYPPPKA